MAQAMDFEQLDFERLTPATSTAGTMGGSDFYTHANTHQEWKARAEPIVEARRAPALNNPFGLLIQLLKSTLSISSGFITAIMPLLPTLILGFFIFNVLKLTLFSVCRLPGSSHVVPYCASSKDSHAEFGALINIQSRLEEVQEMGAGGITLPLLMKRSEAAIRDVAIIVKHSKVPSRVQITSQLTDFYQLADTTGENLSSFLAGVDRMMDSVIVTNERTLRSLRRLAHTTPPSISSQALAVLIGTDITTSGAVRTHYLSHLSKLKGDIDGLILHAQLVAQNLRDLETITWTIKGIATGDKQDIANEKKEVQGRFWAWFGGYGDLLAGFEEQRVVLRGLDTQTDWAFHIVSGVLVKLRELRIGLEDLRVRISLPSLVPEGELELQIDVIHKGVLRLEAGRLKTKGIKRKVMADLQKQLITRAE